MIDTIEYKPNSPAGNSTFAIGGVSFSADSFVVIGSSVLRMNIVLKSPPMANLQNVSGQLNRRPIMTIK